MKELDRAAEAFVREAASAEAEMVLSRAQRDEIRRRFAARRSAGRGQVRPDAPMRAAAGVGGALAFGVPSWAAAALGLALVAGGTAAVVVARRHAPPPVASADARSAELPPLDHGSRPMTPDQGAAPAPADATLPTIGSPVAAPSPPASRHVVAVPAAASARSALPAASSSRNQAPEGGLGGEAALLESAERALRDHDGPRVLALLDEHSRRFPDGIFLVEAEAARAIATCDMGDRERGNDLAAELARRWPNAPVLPRVLAACRTPPTDPSRP
jgi:hypothetical protein